ncbi:MAG: hypothetical protein KGI71_04555 [Patescibacteria group bacterium]|nr:hypothetical protein [Patescibacteria group bacterium]
MSIRYVYTCDVCGVSREMPYDDSPDGWYYVRVVWVRYPRGNATRTLGPKLTVVDVDAKAGQPLACSPGCYATAMRKAAEFLKKDMADGEAERLADKERRPKAEVPQ